MPLDWIALTPSLLAGVDPARVDPHLRLADGTGFVDHLPAPPAPGSVLRVSVALQPQASRPGLPGMKVPAAYPAGSRCFTARLTAAALPALLMHPDVARVQLAEGLRPQRPRGPATTPWPTAALTRAEPAAGPGTALLLGVIDTGCPFAHVDLRRPNGLDTRVVRHWRQDGDQGVGLGRVPASMGYGAELTDADLRQLMNQARDARGALDEHACYLRAGMAPLLTRVSHGAHALGLLAGHRFLHARPQRGAGPVQTRPVDDAAAAADIAFVQLPQALLDVPCPPAMEHHLVDGLRYLLAVARERQATRLVVSIGYESWLGPHDDSSWFSEAAQSLVDDAGAANITCEVFVIAGNGGDDPVHAVLTDPPQAQAGQPRQAMVQIQLPPGCEAPTAVELWLPEDGGLRDDLTLQITPPGHPPLPPQGWDAAVAWPSAAAPAACLVMDRRSRTLGARGSVAVLRLAASQAGGGPGGVAPPGVWTLTVSSTQSLADLHVYVGRGTASMNAPRRGRQAGIICRDPQATPATRSGTLSAHAAAPAVRVATAAVPADAVQRRRAPADVAPYAGIGPSRGPRVGPDFSVVVERGKYHRGHPGIGNRSGAVVRMSGTSVAAPLGARLAFDPAMWTAVAATSPVVPPAPATLGAFLYDPPA